MPYINCPDCYARFQIPDASAETTARCPKCMRVFPVAPEPAPRSTAAVLETPANPHREPAHEEPFNAPEMNRPARVLSAADEAMLRELGSGTGLLEMTREAIDSLPVGLSAHDLAGGPDAAALADRQFQIVGTALTMANKVAEVYKTELARARRLLVLMWIGGAVVLAGGLLAFWWGMTQSSSASLERTNMANSAEKVADLKSRFEEEKTRSAQMTEELQVLRADARKAQADSAVLREALSQRQSDLQTLTTELQAAGARAAQLQEQLNKPRTAATLPGPRDGAASVAPSRGSSAKAGE